MQVTANVVLQLSEQYLNLMGKSTKSKKYIL